MTLQEINEILDNKYRHVKPEEPNPEQQWYNNNINKIRRAIEWGLLKLAEVDCQTIKDWIENGIDGDLEEKISIRIIKEIDKIPEDVLREVYGDKPGDVWDDTLQYFDVKEGGEETKDAGIAYKIRKFFGLAAHQSISPENAIVKKGWANRIKEYLKEKAETVKKFIEDKFER